MARILVVNDIQVILELFRTLISDIEHVNPDLIILDFVFGDQKTGWQMLQMLKMRRSTATIPVIACTAALDLVREQEGYLVSQDVHVIFKPFDIDQLLASVKQALQSHEHVISTDREEREKKQ